MSAFMVGKVHIDALLSAGLARRGFYGPLSWLEGEITDEDRRDCFARGEVWGPRAIELYKERKRELTDDTAGTVGAMLLAENRASVDHRYDEDEIEEPYLFSLLRGSPDPVVVLKALACYEYQSCEHPEWATSEAKRFCEALRDRMIALLPGYDTVAGWEIQDDKVFLNAAASRATTV